MHLDANFVRFKLQLVRELYSFNTSSMPPSPPDWVILETQETQGQDLLGLRATVQTIGNEWLNGLTSVTPKLRYLSVITWIAWRYGQAGMADDKRAFEEYAAVQEAAFVLSNLTNGGATGNLVGIDKARILHDQRGQRVQLERLVRNIGFNIYASASRQLGLTYQIDSGLHGVSQERGVPLAHAFDRPIADTGYGRRLRRHAHPQYIMRTELQELSRALALDQLPRRERTIIVDAILPRQPLNDDERRRRATFSLLLWLSADKGGGVTSDDLFAAAHEPPGGIPDTLRPVLDGWLDYSIRDLIAVSHEAVFDAVMTAVDESPQKPALSAKVVAALIGETKEHDEALRGLNLLEGRESVRDIPFARIWTRVLSLCEDQQNVANGLRRWRAGLSEMQLGDAAMEAGVASAAILPVAWCLAAHRLQLAHNGMFNTHRSGLLDAGQFFQLGLRAVILPKVHEFIQSDRSYIDVMAELIVRTVQQHTRIAWTRFAAPPHRDVSVLVTDLDIWLRNKDFNAGRTDSRLWVAISWLYQLSLMDENGITADGARILDRSLPDVAAA